MHNYSIHSSRTPHLPISFSLVKMAPPHQVETSNHLETHNQRVQGHAIHLHVNSKNQVHINTCALIALCIFTIDDTMGLISRATATKA